MRWTEKQYAKRFGVAAPKTKQRVKPPVPRPLGSEPRFVCRIVVEVDIAPLSNNQQNVHWGTLRRRRAMAQEFAAAAWIQAGRPKSEQAVSVSITVRRGRLLDEDNVFSGLQPIINGLFKGRVVWDDGPQWVTLLPVKQETGSKWKGKPEVEVKVERR